MQPKAGGKQIQLSGRHTDEHGAIFLYLFRPPRKKVNPDRIFVSNLTQLLLESVNYKAGGGGSERPKEKLTAADLLETIRLWRETRDLIQHFGPFISC